MSTLVDMVYRVRTASTAGDYPESSGREFHIPQSQGHARRCTRYARCQPAPLVRIGRQPVNTGHEGYALGRLLADQNLCSGRAKPAPSGCATCSPKVAPGFDADQRLWRLLSIVLHTASIAYDENGESSEFLGQVYSLKSIATGTVYRLDDFLYERKPCRWLGIGPEPNCHIPAQSGRCLLLRKQSRLYAEDDELLGNAMINGIPLAGDLVEIRPGNLLTVGSESFIACGADGEQQMVHFDIAEQKRRLAELIRPRQSRTHAAKARQTATRTHDKRLDGESVRHLRQLPDGPLQTLHEYVDARWPDVPLSIGASDSNTIIVDDPRVSDQHCLLAFSNGHWHVCDNGSKNDVFLNTVELAPHHYAKLRPGQVLQIGRVRFLACGRRGLDQRADITAPTVPEYARLSIQLYGSPSLSARCIRVARKTLWKWLPRRHQSAKGAA